MINLLTHIMSVHMCVVGLNLTGGDLLHFSDDFQPCLAYVRSDKKVVRIDCSEHRNPIWNRVNRYYVIDRITGITTRACGKESSHD